jgi:hypothetical protein
MFHLRGKPGARAITAALLCGLLAWGVAGCGALTPAGDAGEEKQLADVVDAIQYAIDQAASEKVWLATEKEVAHWQAACTAARDSSSRACTVMSDRAIDLCKAICTSGNCDPASEMRCHKYARGEDVSGLCADGSRAAWCSAARECSAQNTRRTQVCANLATVQLPQIDTAQLSVAVERSRNAAAGISVLVVSFGGGRTDVSSNVVNMTLKPRVRDADYGVVPMAPIPAKQVSPEARLLAAQMAGLIREAVTAAAKEYEPSNPQVAARPPMLMSDLQVTFSLVVDRNGSLGIKKAWEAPAGIELSAGLGTKRTNSLTITYTRPQ